MRRSRPTFAGRTSELAAGRSRHGQQRHVREVQVRLWSHRGDLWQSAVDALHLLGAAAATHEGEEVMDVPREVLLVIAVVALLGCAACLFFAIKDRW